MKLLFILALMIALIVFRDPLVAWIADAGEALMKA